MWRRVLVSLLCAGCGLAHAGDQYFTQVFDVNSGRPISGAVVSLTPQDGAALEVETDAEGLAAFPEQKAGAYWLRAEKPGYVDLLDAGGRGRPIRLSPANGSPARIGLTRAAAISGQVFDSQGRPLAGAQVSAIVRRWVHGEPRWTLAGNLGGSDDQGAYRLHGLAPGRYSVVVLPSRGGSGADVLAPAGYGSSDPAQAVFFELGPGETRPSVNLTVAAAETPSISGKVTGIPEGTDAPRAAVGLVARGGLRLPLGAVLTDADGAFVFPSVSPGEYLLMAWTPFSGWEPTSLPAGASARAATRLVTVSSDDVQADLELRPLVKASGGLLPAGNQCHGTGQIALHSEDNWQDVWELAVTVDGSRFTVENLPPGRYSFEMPALGATCRLAAVRVGEQEAPGGVAWIDGSAPLTLVLSTETGEVSGEVTAQEGMPAAGFVVLTPADGAGPARVAALDAKGRYRLPDVLAGTYNAIAVEQLRSADYLDPLEARKLGAMPIAVEAGRKVTCDLRLVGR